MSLTAPIRKKDDAFAKIVNPCFVAGLIALFLTVFSVLNAAPAYAAGGVEVNGDLQLSGTGTIFFADGTSQSTAPALTAHAGTTNTAIGVSTLPSNTTGYQNMAGGWYALFSNTDGYSNVADGAYALYSNTGGSENTATGASALFANSSGYVNTASGSYSLYSNDTGIGNVADGSYALYSNIDGYSNAAVGLYALYSNTGGYNNTAVGADALLSNTTGSGNTAVGAEAGAAAGDLVDATAIGYNAKVDASYHVRIGDVNVTEIGGQVAWSNLSDIRQKKDVRDITKGLDFVRSLRPVEFRLRNGNDRIDFGFVAQDIEGLLGTNYNILGVGGDGARTLSLRYTDFIAPVVKAIQEQQRIIEKQNEIIGQMQRELAELKAMMTSRAGEKQ